MGLGAILLWLAETLGGAALKAWIGGLFKSKPAVHDEATVAAASRSSSQAQGDEQVIKNQEDRIHEDQQAGNAGDAAVTRELRDHWNEP